MTKRAGTRAYRHGDAPSRLGPRKISRVSCLAFWASEFVLHFSGFMVSRTNFGVHSQTLAVQASCQRRTAAFASGCVASKPRSFVTTSGCAAARFFVSAGSAA
jgi:hypothetical protein